MPWTFDISAHSLSKDGTLVDSDVYSGAFPEGFNDPGKCDQYDVGPIPVGFWRIPGPPFSTKEHGPYVLRLEPEATTETFGRTGFLLHGKPLPPKDIRSGSKGCICAGLDTRRRVYQSADTRLEVISGVVAIDPEITT